MIYLAILLILAVVCLSISCYEVHHFRVTSYEITSAKVQKDYHILFVSDLHGCTYGEHNEKLIAKIRQINPDLLLVGGDLYTASKHGTTHTEEAVYLLEILSRQYPVYYVNGNHETRSYVEKEIYGDVYERYSQEIRDKEIPVHLLNNASARIDSHLTISGLEIDHVYYNKEMKEYSLPGNYINTKLGEPDPDRYTILIAHNPLYFARYAQWGADLVLSGHNHGNIIHIPLLGGLISPRFHLFDRYDRGEFYQEGSRMILGGGMGTHTIKVRLFNMPELLDIHLKAQK